MPVLVSKAVSVRAILNRLPTYYLMANLFVSTFRVPNGNGKRQRRQEKSEYPIFGVEDAVSTSDLRTGSECIIGDGQE